MSSYPLECLLILWNIIIHNNELIEGELMHIIKQTQMEVIEDTIVTRVCS